MFVICYVNDLLVYSRDDASINEFVEGMKSHDIRLRREDTAEGFLGVDIKYDATTITLKQEGLTKRIIEALGLSSSYTTACSAPAESAALPKDADGPPAVGHINYASVIGMLLYLCGHSRSDIAFTVHQCARYTFAPKRVHEGPIPEGYIV